MSQCINITMSQSPFKGAATQHVKLFGDGIKVPVRSAPNSQGSITRFLLADSVVEVKVMNSKGFYRLADDSVSI